MVLSLLLSLSNCGGGDDVDVDATCDIQVVT
jgi:hypothetical protein